MLNKCFLGVLLLSLGVLSEGYGQMESSLVSQHAFFQEIKISCDTTTTYFPQHAVSITDDLWGIPIKISSYNPTVEIRISLSKSQEVSDLKILSSDNFDILEEPIALSSDLWRMKIKFKNLFEDQFNTLTFALWTLGGEEILQEFRLLPYASTSLELAHISGSRSLYIGEEVEYELISNFPQNIRVENTWEEYKDISYRVYSRADKLFVSILPKSNNVNELSIKLKTFIPQQNESTFIYETEELYEKFKVKKSRIAFLKTSMSDVIMTQEASGKGVEIQIDNHRSLKLNRTYRIENQEEAGGELIADLFTRTMLSNNRVLCWLRLYKTHKISDGNLYLKTTDKARFITNFNILPKPKIKEVSILRAGRNWTQNLSVHPNENIEVRFRGEGLQKANIVFNGLHRSLVDSVMRTEKEVTMKVHIPMEIDRQRIEILNDDQSSPYQLNVTEYQKPRKFDFISLEFGEEERLVEEIDQPIFAYKSLSDIVLKLHPEMLDSDEQLDGKQYLSLEIQMRTPKGQLVELAKDDNIVICPSTNSPRYYNYPESEQCRSNSISLNQYLVLKTHKLGDWYRMEIKIQHRKEKYADPIYTKKVVFYAARKNTFDVELSFPAGLIVKKTNEDDFVNGLSGLSIAAIAEFKFYKPGTVGKLRPYRIGFGTIFFNTFNFNENEETLRDLGIVVLGSVHPLYKPGRKLSLPIYIGGGYLLKENTFFWTLGPGLKINF